MLPMGTPGMIFYMDGQDEQDGDFGESPRRHHHLLDSRLRACRFTHSALRGGRKAPLLLRVTNARTAGATDVETGWAAGCVRSPNAGQWLQSMARMGLPALPLRMVNGFATSGGS